MHIEYLPNPALPLFPVNIDNEIKAAPNIRLDGIQVHATVSTHHQGSKAMNGFLGAAGMDGGQSSTMSGIHCVQESPRFRPAHFAHDDAVWPVSKHCFEQVIEGDLAAMRIRLGLGGDKVRLADMQLRSILDNKDAFVLRDSVGQDVQDRRFSRPGSPAMRMFRPSRTA